MEEKTQLSVFLPIHDPDLKVYFKNCFKSICEQKTDFVFDIYIVDDCSKEYKETKQYKELMDFINNYDTKIIVNYIEGARAKTYDADITNKDAYKKRACLGPANAYTLMFKCLLKNEESYAEKKCPDFFVGVSQDNVLTQNKLQVLYNTIKDSDYDVVFNSWKESKTKIHVYNNKDLTFEDLLNDDGLCKMTNAICRVESYKKLPFLWSPYWKSLYDYEQFTFAKFRRDFKFCAIPDVLNYNKNHKEQFSKKDVTRKGYISMIKNIYKNYDGVPEDNLTCILMFRNESNEIEKTIQNIRATTNNAPIVLVDDCSNDGYNYEELEKIYPNVRYYRNEENYGTAYSRDLGVKKTNTDFFVQLDGHMRFYKNNWVEYALSYLKLYPDCILCSRSVTIRKNKMEIYDNEDGAKYNSGSCGAFINTADAYEFTSHWSNAMTPEKEKQELIEIPCCLGACYFSSKAHWIKIKGLEGLMQWGQEEPMMSIKTWLLGGKVLLLNKLWSGHVYREKRPYTMDNEKTTFNHLLLNHLFTDKQEMADQFDEFIAKRFPVAIMGAYKLFKDNIDKIQNLKTYICLNRVHDMNWFFKFNEQFMTDDDWNGKHGGYYQKKLR